MRVKIKSVKPMHTKQGTSSYSEIRGKPKFNQNVYLGPYVIKAVRDNGTVRARKGIITDIIIICNLTPYKE